MTRTIVIVGGTSGIGLEIAKDAVSRGENVVLTGRDLEGARAVAATLGDQATGLAVDLSEPEAIQKNLESVGPINGLVLSAI